jgi:hypothetical protein
MDEVKEVRVTKPEDWPAAADLHSTFILDTLSDIGIMTFKLRAMSYGELRELEEQIPTPEAPVIREARAGVAEVRDYDNLEFQERLNKTLFVRWMMWIDKCWKPLPGATQGEKVQWAEANLWRNGEITKVFNELRKLSGMNTGKAAISNAVAAAEPKEADPEMWAKASQAARLSFKIPHGETVLVFDMVGLSQLKVNQISEMCRPPAPPMCPEVHKMTHKPIPGTEAPDYTDPGYQQALTDGSKYENCLLLEAAMFTFPGATKEEKLKWLEARPCYEVISLRNHLAQNVMGYHARTDFI